MVFNHIYDPPTLEALAISEALALADDLYIRRVHIALDCKVVIDDLKGDSRASYGAVLKEVSVRSSSYILCDIVYEFRSSNFEAHNLAKHSLTLGLGRHVWLVHPEDLPFVSVNIVTG